MVSSGSSDVVCCERKGEDRAEGDFNKSLTESDKGLLQPDAVVVATVMRILSTAAGTGQMK